ncbi:MAG TPA: energy transducer TonB [Vicinamibacteria bacterium]|nr:energy transducer TonB [Vicinamibacteria bacterium]
MSPVRTLLHVGLSASVVLLAGTRAASPLHAAPPAAGATVSLETNVAEPPAPRLLKQVKPVYPPEARDAKVRGVFTIDVVIGTDGAIRDARLVASAPTLTRLQEIVKDKSKAGTPAAIEGDPRLAQAALDAVKQWQYEPVVKAGKPAEAKATVTVEFSLAEGKASS